MKKISIVCLRHRSGLESKGQALALGLSSGRGEESLEMEQKVCVYGGGVKSDQQKNPKKVIWLQTIPILHDLFPTMMNKIQPF